MSANSRIALNTLATYARSLFGVGLALFSSRWVLNSLGQSDFGLYNVVGSIIVFVVFLNNVMAAGAARFFAYSIGQGDQAQVNKWFNAALSIHLCMASVLVIVSWPAGTVIINKFLQIPADRIRACIWTFHASLVSAFFSMIAVPFVAMFIAKQRIAELAAWGLIQSILSFVLALNLRGHEGDLLVFYATGMVAIILFMQTGQIIRGTLLLKECKVNFAYWFDPLMIKSIFSFCSWSIIGSAGSVIRDNGSAVLLNLYFGPKENAAYGIAMQVSNQANQLSASMAGAFSPEITASEGRGERKRMLSLSNKASKFGSLLVILFAIPLIIEMDYVLKIWLKTPPPHAAIFCKLILITFVIDRLTTGFMLAVNAKGNIAAYQSTVGGCILLTLPIAWILLKLGVSSISVTLASLFTMTCATIGRALWVKKIFEQDLNIWLKDVVLVLLIIIASTLAAGTIPHLYMEESKFRLLVVCFSTITTYAISVSIFGLTKAEKTTLHTKAGSIISRFTNWRSN